MIEQTTNRRAEDKNMQVLGTKIERLVRDGVIEAVAPALGIVQIEIA